MFTSQKAMFLGISPKFESRYPFQLWSSHANNGGFYKASLRVQWCGLEGLRFLTGTSQHAHRDLVALITEIAPSLEKERVVLLNRIGKKV